VKIPTSISRRDEIFMALAVAILGIGTATGSAKAMLVMGLVGLVLMTTFYRKQLGAAVLAAVSVAAVMAFAIVRFLSA